MPRIPRASRTDQGASCCSGLRRRHDEPDSENKRRRITLFACMALIAVLSVLLAVTRSWGKDDWLFALLIFTMFATYLGLELTFDIIK